MSVAAAWCPCAVLNGINHPLGSGSVEAAVTACVSDSLEVTMLDLRTVVLLTIVATVVFLFVTIFLSRLLPDERNLRLWIATAATDLLALALLGLRGVIPDLASIGLGNTAAIAGMCLSALASRGLVGRRTSRGWYWALIPWVLAAFLAFSFFLPDQADRIMANAVFNVPPMLAAAWALWQRAPGVSRTISRVSSLVFLLGAALYFLRGAFALGVTSSVDFSATPSTITAAPYVFAMVLTLWLSTMLTLTVSGRIQHRLRMERDRAEAANKELLVLSTTDSLTGLFNRAKVDAVLTDAVANAKAHQQPLAIALLDLDGFKDVNDTYGHPVGDTVLVGFGHILTGHVRASDTIGRWGGEEFLVVLPNTGIAAAELIAEDMRQAVGAVDHPICGPVTASFGVTEYRAGDDGPRLVARADRAMYGAKQLGRNRVVVL